MKSNMRKSLFVALLFTVASAQAQQTVTSREAFAAFGFDVDNLELRVEPVAPGLHLIIGAGGNILASIGEQGVLIVDDQVPELIPRIQKSIHELGGGDIDFVINTHWHFDHADGNEMLGSEGSWIISQANSREMLKDRQLINLVGLKIDQPAYPDVALPVITYENQMQLHFNGEQIDLLHVGPAHTSGDTVVFFRGSNVVHMGDVFNSRYPFIDADNGGDLDGAIRFCEQVLAEIDENTKVVPGHGVVGSRQDFADYVSMLKTIRQRIAAMIADGASLEEVIAAKPTAEWDDAKGDPTRLINRAYTSLSK
jgi:glyoxylase-like metal-dependent hydrolase (beta-lactamase superfamily II)